MTQNGPGMVPTVTPDPSPSTIDASRWAPWGVLVACAAWWVLTTSNASLYLWNPPQGIGIPTEGRVAATVILAAGAVAVLVSVWKVALPRRWQRVAVVLLPVAAAANGVRFVVDSEAGSESWWSVLSGSSLLFHLIGWLLLLGVGLAAPRRTRVTNDT